MDTVRDCEPTPEQQLRIVYRERARLIAFISACYPSAIGIDPGEPDWPVVYVTSPSGQLAWHLHKDDLDLFEHVPDQDAPAWDGHSTEEKYRRLRELTKRQRALRPQVGERP